MAKKTKLNEAEVEVVSTETVAPATEQQTEKIEEATITPAEEPAQPEPEPVVVEEENIVEEESTPQIPLMKTKEEVLACAKEIAEKNDGGDKQELDLLKQLYYKYTRADLLAAREAYIEAGGDPETYTPEPDPTEEAFKEIMQQIRQRRAELQAEAEQQRAENLTKKLEVIEKIKQLATTPEEAGKSYDTFKEL